MKVNFKRYIIVFMSLLLMFSFPTVSEAAKVSFSKKTYTVKVKKTVKLKAKNLAKGEKIVKWKVSNPKVAKISKSGNLKALRVGKIKVTAITNEGRKFSCKVVVKGNSSSGHSGGHSGGGAVYWTPGGSVYHYSRSCPTLSRSRTVYSGSISESGKPRGCKVCG